MTDAEAELLDRLGLLAQKDFSDIKDKAFAEAERRFTSDDQNDDHQDAFRHTYWNALLTQRFGPDWTAKYTTAHEGLEGNPGHREAMDLFNNDLGRRIALEHPGAPLRRSPTTSTGPSVRGGPSWWTATTNSSTATRKRSAAIP